jgi:hypothetical protein
MADRAKTLLLAALLAVASISAAAAAPGADAAQITGFSVAVSSSQAGGHPDLDLQATLDTRETASDPSNCSCADPSEVKVRFPEGVIGDPHALPTCSLLQLAQTNCPVAAQVGVASAIAGQEPLYNMEPHPDEAGLVGFAAPLVNAPVFIVLSARTDSDYGLTATTAGIFHLASLRTFQLHLWGVPGDPKHDINRWPAPQGGRGACLPQYPEQCNPAQPFGAPVRPYFENPTACGAASTLGLDVRFYDGSLDHATGPWPAMTGCDQLSFNPSLTAKPTTTQADSPSGLDVELNVPQTQSPGTPSPSEIRASTVTLPPGFSINTNAADGKVSCTDEEASFGTVDAAHCPEHAKVGTLSIDSSALPAPIDGAIYIGEPTPGYKYRLFLTADGFATHVKIAGYLALDPSTGQITVSLPNLPQTPFQKFTMHFFGSERGVLATPTRCGSYPVNATFVPWDSALSNQTSLSSFTVDSGPDGTPCPGSTRPFDPLFEAGNEDNTAGVFTPFFFDLSRKDGDQNLKGLDLSEPPGFSARLVGVPYCPEAALAALADPNRTGTEELVSPLCPAASQVGTATTATGAGSRPLFTSGKVYLAGPYQGAPLSLVVVLPAVSGPYDLGNVVERTAVRIDPETARISTGSEEIPDILSGIPLRVRSVQINLDRPGFTLNPTNCHHFAVNADVFGSEGGVAHVGSPFQAANCASLPYEPSLSLRLTGGVRRLGHPAIHAVFQAAPGEANSKTVSVALPEGEQVDNAHLGSVCTRVQFAANSCPATSVLGTATVTTPLLDQPLTGKAYLRSSSRGLPNLVLDLQGQIHIVLVGRIDTVNGGALRTTFQTVPDAPVSTFKLDLAGGSKGLITNSETLCGKGGKALVRTVGQNGAVVKTSSRLKTSCGSNGRHKRHHRGHRRSRG